MSIGDWLSETYVEGSGFDVDNYWRELQPLWVWAEEWQPQMRKAAPIADGEIIEQAKEEAFLAWGL
jgi:hypothetical protein